MPVESLIPLVLGAAIVPLVISIFFYVTKPSAKHRWRVPATAWLNPIGIQIVAQKSTLVVLLTFIIFSRLNPDFPGRQVIAFILYAILVGTFWAFLFVQRSVQKPYEAEIRKRRKR